MEENKVEFIKEVEFTRPTESESLALVYENMMRFDRRLKFIHTMSGTTVLTHESKEALRVEFEQVLNEMPLIVFDA